MKTRRLKVCILFFIFSAGGSLFLLPVIFTVIKSLTQSGPISAEGYYLLLFECFPFYRMFWNSVLYSLSVTVGSLMIAIPAAFAFKFAQFRAKNVIFLLYIVIMLMPIQVMVLPNYIGLRDLKLIDTPFAIILPLIFSPMAVVVLHQYLRECDVQVVEAARLETNSVILVILHCILPQIRVCVFAVGLLVFAETWNLLEPALLFLNDDKWRNLSVMFADRELYQPGVILPASVLFMIPVLLAYMYFSDELQITIREVKR